jgi:hypothetical protein
MYDRSIDAVDEINYLGVTLDYTGGWNKQKAKLRAKGSQTLAAIDKCLVKIPDATVKILEKVYEMVCESKLMYGAKVWSLEEVWKKSIKFMVGFVKNYCRFLDLQQTVWLHWS